MNPVLIELLLTCMFSLLGFIFLNLFGLPSRLLKICLSFPVGCSIYSFTSVLFLAAVDRFYSMETVVTLMAILVCMNIYLVCKRKISPGHWIDLFYLLPAIGTISAVLYLCGATVMSFDSFQFAFATWVLTASHSVGPAVHKLVDYPIFIQVMHGAARSLNGELYHSFSPIIFLTCITSAIHIMFAGKRNDLTFLFASFGIVTAFLANWMNLLMLFYINSHAAVAGYLALSVFGIRSLKENVETRSWVILPISMATLVLLRLEGPILVAILLCTLPLGTVSRKKLMIVGFAPFLTVAIWYGLLATKTVDDGIIGPKKIVGMLLLLAGPIVFIAFTRLNRFYRFLQILCLGSLTIVMLAVFALNPTHMAKSISSMFLNTFVLGYWGFTWLVTAAMLSALFVFIPLPNRKELLFTVSATLVAYVILGYLRTDLPFRVGWGDSANRMMFHILPVCLITILLFIEHALSKNKTQPLGSIGGSN